MSTHTPTSMAVFDGKVALITGSSRGLGRENALELARRGASVVINYCSSASAAEQVVKEVEALGRKAIAIRADVSKPEEIAQLFEQAVKHFGKIDIVVSNSGIEHFGPLESVTPEQFDAVFSINTRGQFFVAQQAYKHLQDSGRLILLSSISAQLRGVANHAVYSGSKSAVEAFARCFAKDFGKRNITVNAIAPGGVKTDMYSHNARNYIPGAADWDDQQVDEAMSNISPLKRPGVPEDVASVVAFLSSEDGRWINGQVITITGGAAMG